MHNLEPRQLLCPLFSNGYIDCVVLSPALCYEQVMCQSKPWFPHDRPLFITHDGIFKSEF